MNEMAASPPELSLRQRALHLFSLSSFAVAQPMFDLLGRHAQFFVAHDSRPGDLVALVAVLILLLPALLFSVELIAGLVAARAGRSLHSVLVTFLAAATILQVLKRIPGVPGLAGMAAALALGIATAAVYDRSSGFRTYLTWLTPAPLVFGGAFLLLTPVRTLVFPPPFAPPTDVEIRAEVPVVMVVFDELSLPTLMDESHSIDAERFPSFARLGERSHWFRNATTIAEFTPIAVAALLSGRGLGEDVPGSQLIASADRYPDSLFTLLAPQYELHVFETVTSVCPRQLCGAPRYDADPIGRVAYLLTDAAVVYPHCLLPADLANELPDIGNQWLGFHDFWRNRWKKVEHFARGDKPRQFSEFLATLRSGKRRALYFVHSSLPHGPWRYLPSGRDYEPPGGGLVFNDGLVKQTWVGGDYAAQVGFQRYLLQLGYVDRLVGELIDTLEDAGLWDPALVVVTADHGVSFRSGGARRKLTPENFQDILPVPLFIKLPFQRQGAVSDRNVELIDVLPTIVDVLGIEEGPWPMDGASVFDPGAAERREKRVFVEPYRRDNVKTFDPADFDTHREAIERKSGLFGNGTDPLSLFRIGPRPELVGRPVAELETASEPRGEMWLKRPEIYDDVDPDSGFLPVRVVGETRGLENGSVDLAIAVEGTVWAVIRTRSDSRGRTLFAAVVPEEAFTAGRNTVEIFTVSGDAAAPRLTPIAEAPRKPWWRTALARIRRQVHG